MRLIALKNCLRVGLVLGVVMASCTAIAFVDQPSKSNPHRVQSGAASPADPNDNNDEHNSDFPSNPDISFANNLVSLSSDGHYAVSSNLANQIILWDLVAHTQKVISNHANSYSAYFIKHSPYFMWQELPANQLQFATSAGKPPIDKLQLVGQNKLGIISEEDKKFYVYFCGNLDKINSLGAVVKKPLPLDDNAQFLVHGDLRHYGDNFDFSPYGRPYNLVTELVSQMRFIEVLITLGYQSGNIVHVQDVSGKEVLHFDNFPVYGQVMRANLKDYFASSFNWNVYQGYGANQKLIMIDDGGFYSGKLLNLTLSDAKPLLLTSGEDPDSPVVTGANFILGNMTANHLSSNIHGVTLWNSQTGQPLHGFMDNIGKTFATLSPDGNYVVAGDENSNLFIWNTATFQKLEDWSLYSGKVVSYDKENGYSYSDKGLVKPPAGFLLEDGNRAEDVFSIQFIDKEHYFRFTLGIPYAVLFSVHNPKPLKYFFLGKINPAIFDYSQDQALDSSPSKHILVMSMSGQRGGILEYQYDPKNMTLKRIWVGHLTMPAIAYGEHQDKIASGWFS